MEYFSWSNHYDDEYQYTGYLKIYNIWDEQGDISS